MADQSDKVEELKKELLSLGAKRKQIDDEIILHRVVLENNKIGMSESLVDREDFPRNDIDVYAVRHARSSIIKLENDAKDLFKLMHTKLEELHSLSRDPDDS